MNDNQNRGSIGNQINGALNEALKTGDFTNLNDLVFQTASDTLNEAGKHIAKSLSGIQADGQNRQTSPDRARHAQTNPYKSKQAAPAAGARTSARTNEGFNTVFGTQTRANIKNAPAPRPKQQVQRKTSSKTTAVSAVKFRQIGSVSNVLYQVFGGIGLGVSSLIAFLRLPATFYGAASPIGWIINILFIAFSFGMIHSGVRQRNRLKRARRYIQLCGGRMYGQIENLARDTGNSVRYVIKDIRKMLNLGMFPEGHLDGKQTCLMLDDSVHRQYLEAENSRRIREAEERSALIQKETSAKADSQPSSINGEQENELNTMIAEGMECIRKLRELNDKIPGEVISAKLYKLESLLKDIFDSVREHPEQMHRMHKMMDYYLPTTLKLVEAYEEFDRINTPGEEIIAAKAEIERTLDIINQAFTELLNNLFQEAVFDATTDAQVLKTMLAREGLTKDADFAKSL